MLTSIGRARFYRLMLDTTPHLAVATTTRAPVSAISPATRAEILGQDHELLVHLVRRVAENRLEWQASGARWTPSAESAMLK